MIFRQLFCEPIAAASYLIGCVATGEAAVVDPSLPAEQYALLAADKGLRIRAVLETHMHADYFSTGRAIQALTGATIYAPRLADLRFAHTPLDDGALVRVGNVAITALHTPGHTPEHTCYLVSDTPRGEEPWFVLTGDCLFVGDVGRADLISLPLTGPEVLYHSIFDKLLALPDTVEIYPTHYGGSACGGKAMSGKVASTIGFERRHNWALQAPDKESFVRQVSGDVRAAVEGVLLHRNTNRGELPLPADYARGQQAPQGDPTPSLTLEQARAANEEGAVLIDLRHQQGFAAGHPAGALNLSYNRSNLAERVAALTTPDEPLLLIADQPFVAGAAAALLAGVARNPVLGAVAASVGDWQAAGLPTASLPTLTVDELYQRVIEGMPLILDVREPFEWEKGVIEGAALISIGEVLGRLAELPRHMAIIVICESGARASAVSSLLLRKGYPMVESVSPEGMSLYAQRYPTVPCSSSTRATT